MSDLERIGFWKRLSESGKKPEERFGETAIPVKMSSKNSKETGNTKTRGISSAES